MNRLSIFNISITVGLITIFGISYSWRYSELKKLYKTFISFLSRSIGISITASSPLQKDIQEIMRHGHGIPGLFKSMQSASLSFQLLITNSSLFQVSVNETNDLNEFISAIHRLERLGTRIHLLAQYQTKIIVLEGLSGSGKTLLINNLLRKSSKYRSIAFPTYIASLNRLIDDSNSSKSCLRYAYQCLRNYLMIDLILTDIQSAPEENLHYFIDSFYHRVLVECILSHVDNPTYPSLQSSVFDWPMDLAIPNMVIFLYVTTSTRLLHLQMQEQGDESIEIADEDSLLTSTISEMTSNIETDLIKNIDEQMQMAYSMVRGPQTIAIDANTVPMEVCEVALEALKEYGFYTPPPKKATNQVPNRRMSMGIYGSINRLSVGGGTSY